MIVILILWNTSSKSKPGNITGISGKVFPIDGNMINHNRKKHSGNVCDRLKASIRSST